MICPICGEKAHEIEGKYYCFCSCCEIEAKEEKDQKKGEKLDE
jgi:hypothetical protein